MTDAVLDFVAASSTLWRMLVELCRINRSAGDEQLAQLVVKHTGASKGSVTTKIRAVRYALELGISYEQITAEGQSVTLKRFSKAKNKNAEKKKRLSFTVPASLADAFMSDVNPDAEEATVSRIQRVCKINTSEELIEFLKALIDNMTDIQLAHEAGLISADQIPRKRKHAKA